MSDYNQLSTRLILIYLIVSVSVFQQGVNFQMMMFIYYPPKHLCRSPNVTGVTVSPDNCQYFIKENNTITKHQCQSWDFDKSQVLSTFVSELSLVCQYRYLQLLIIPLRQVSSIFNLVLALLSDVKGRKILFMISIFLDSIFWILLGVLPTNYLSHIILRCIKSSISASAPIGFVLLSELTPTRYRNMVAINYWVPFSLGTSVAPLYMWITYDWRSALLLSSIPNIIYLAAPFIILESPQWLFTKHRKTEGNDISEQLKLNIFIEESEDITEDQTNKHDLEFCKELQSILESCTMVTRILVLFFTSFTFYFVYQGFTTNVTFANSNIYVNAIILGLVELPSGPISSFCSQYFGSVFSTLLAIFLVLICYIMYNVLLSSIAITNVTSNATTLVLACLIRSLLSGAWNIQGIFYVTLMPTTVRNFFNNFGEIFGKLGAAGGGFFGYYVINNYLTEGMIYGGMLFVSMVLFGLVIPSAKDEPMPQTVEESRMIKKDLLCDNY